MVLAALSAACILSLVALCGTTPSDVDAGHFHVGAPQAATVQIPSLTVEELFSRLHERHEWQETHLTAFSVRRTRCTKKPTLLWRKKS